MMSNVKKKIRSDHRPTDYEYALISQHVYGSGGKNPPEAGQEFQTEYRTWKVVHVRDANCGYFGAVYRCDKTKQFVIAHRGTDGIFDFLENFRGVVLNKFSAQKEEAFSLIDDVILLIRSVFQDYNVSFTGHSLGAFLAELSVFYVTCIKFYETNAVTFESPGSRQSIQMLQETHSEHISLTDINKLDIVTYVCYPNLINVCNEHIGTVYTINVDLSGSMVSFLPFLKYVIGHGISGIIKWFKMAMDENNEDKNLVRRYMADWPRGFKQLKRFFKYAMYQKGKLHIHPDLIQVPESPFPNKSLADEDIFDEKSRKDAVNYWLKQHQKSIKLQFHSNYKIVESLSSYNAMPFHHFTNDLQAFLKDFFGQLQLIRNENGKESVQRVLQDVWKGFDMPEMLINSLLSFEIKMNKTKDIDMEVVLCKENVNLYEFRRKLSRWLEKTGFTAEDLLNEDFIKNVGAVGINLINKHYDMPPPGLRKYPIHV